MIILEIQYRCRIGMRFLEPLYYLGSVLTSFNICWFGTVLVFIFLSPNMVSFLLQVSVVATHGLNFGLVFTGAGHLVRLLLNMTGLENTNLA